MLFDQEHTDISLRISDRLGLPVEEVVKVIKDFNKVVKEELSSAVHDKELPDNYKLLIPNLFTFFSIKGFTRIKRERKLAKRDETIRV